MIIRSPDASLVVLIPEGLHHERDDATEANTEDSSAKVEATTRVPHPGEGGYNETLAAWEVQQNPDRAPAVSTTSGREETMNVVHALAESPEHDVAGALKEVGDVEASGEALRHVPIGGTHSGEAFAEEVADPEGGEPLPAHKMTKNIGEVLAELHKEQFGGRGGERPRLTRGRVGSARAPCAVTIRLWIGQLHYPRVTPSRVVETRHGEHCHPLHRQRRAFGDARLHAHHARRAQR